MWKREKSSKKKTHSLLAKRDVSEWKKKAAVVMGRSFKERIVVFTDRHVSLSE